METKGPLYGLAPKTICVNQGWKTNSTCVECVILQTPPKHCHLDKATHDSMVVKTGCK